MKRIEVKTCKKCLHGENKETRHKVVLMSNGWERWLCIRCGQVSFEKLPLEEEGFEEER